MTIKAMFLAIVSVIFMTASTQVNALETSDTRTVKRNVQKFMNKPEVRDITQRLKEILEVAHNKADEVSDGSLSAFERQWQRQVDELIVAYKNSDIPRKLREGDWSLAEEMMYTLRPDSGEQKTADGEKDEGALSGLENSVLSALKEGKISIEQFMALLKDMYGTPHEQAIHQ